MGEVSSVLCVIVSEESGDGEGVSSVRTKEEWVGEGLGGSYLYEIVLCLHVGSLLRHGFRNR